ncbi:TPA: relaxase, partial [Streptococcus equi subsp. zooepidemicus]|nr:relaxase [Streptococcus equi subsp. zooepidemicus]
EIMKKHNSLSVEYDELEHLKNSMNEYMGNEKTSEMQPKKSIIKQIGDMSKRGQKACNKKVKNRENER